MAQTGYKRLSLVSDKSLISASKDNKISALILSKKLFQLECNSYPQSGSTSASDIDLTPVQRRCRLESQRNTHRGSEAFLEMTGST